MDLGDLLLVRLYKEPFLILPADSWHCSYVTVTCPKGELYQFPCYHWITGFVTLEVHEGKGIILSGDTNPILRKQRCSELERKRAMHQWKIYAEGSPHCIKEDNENNLPGDAQYSWIKKSSFDFTLASTGMEVKFKGFLDCKESWTDLNDINRIFCCKRTPMSELVSQKWKEDKFFGYQFLNGTNPVMIQKCFRIPDNFPVTDHMVAASLGSSTNLHKELQNGNIFLADYKILEGIPANTINGEKQYIAAPLCLLWKSQQDRIIPIAIQLGQTPGEQCPIFLPNDSDWDWTLAKIWVRNSEFNFHQVVTHLLHTHLFAEVFNIATTRHLPMGHPVYKLLIPHIRYTLEINVLARGNLIGPGGLFDQAVVTGNGGVPVLLKKGMERLDYGSLCLPDDIQARGVESIPHYFYRDDGMKIWSAVERFVSDIVRYYYESDETVQTDPELQAWVAEIFKEGFLERKTSGIPSFLETKAELIKYLTMVIFTCSAQHAAVNSGQFDFYSWMPNGPASMRKPPPTAKNTATFQNVLDTLPQVNSTATIMITAWLLSNEPEDKRPLGTYPEEHFTEEIPRKCMEGFKGDLSEISKQIKERNENLELTYLYLDPEVIENSVSI
ncbi:polyunsaturated fatty acid lipoxygenase ALOX15B isoform X2 [Ascaphus truei]